MPLTTSQTHRFSTSILTVALAVFGICAILMAVSDAADADPVSLSAHAGSNDSVAVHVSGAADIQSVGLYVDGHLRQRETKRPWSFGVGGKITLGSGKHKITAVAKAGKHHYTSTKSVTVTGSGGDQGGSDTGSGSDSDNSGTGKGSTGSETTTESTTSTAPTEEDAVGPAEVVEAPTTEPSDPGDGLEGGQILYRGDYDSGNLSQWEMIQRVEANRITIETEQVKEGKYAARFETRPTDWIGETQPRSEVATDLGEKEGEERYYRWYTYFPESFPTEYPEDFITFTQWRALDESDAYSSFMVWGDQIELRREGTQWQTTLTKGVWHKFVYHVKWSANPAEGFIELFYDGKLVLPKKYMATMAGTPGNAIGNYVKEGLYKSQEIPTAYLYQDGFVAGTTYESVNGESD